MEAYESEFAAPEYTVVKRRMIGSKAITLVIIDGELIEFEKQITESDASKN